MSTSTRTRRVITTLLGIVLLGGLLAAPSVGAADN